jgi:hypothetical protein
MAGLERARAARDLLRARLAHHDGVCGIGLVRTADGYAVRVNVTDLPEDDVVPPVVAGVPVHVRVTGPVRALTGRGSSTAGARPPRRR